MAFESLQRQSKREVPWCHGNCFDQVTLQFILRIDSPNTNRSIGRTRCNNVRSLCNGNRIDRTRMALEGSCEDIIARLGILHSPYPYRAVDGAGYEKSRSRGGACVKSNDANFVGVSDQ